MLDTTTYTQSLDSLGGNLNTLFGESARLLPQSVEPLAEGSHIAENWVVWLSLIVLFVAYLFVVFAYGNHTGQMGKVLLWRNLGIRIADEMSYLFMRAVRISLLMGVVMWSLVGVKWLEVAGVNSLGGDSRWLVPMFIVASLAVGATQRLVTNGICALVRRREIAEGLNILAETSMAFVAMLSTPLALLFVANTGESAMMLGSVVVFVGFLGFIVFCTKSLIFFVEQKVSILLLILYLCTAVLIPIGIVATLVVRNSVI